MGYARVEWENEQECERLGVDPNGTYSDQEDQHHSHLLCQAGIYHYRQPVPLFHEFDWDSFREWSIDKGHAHNASEAELKQLVSAFLNVDLEAFMEWCIENGHDHNKPMDDWMHLLLHYHQPHPRIPLFDPAAFRYWCSKRGLDHDVPEDQRRVLKIAYRNDRNVFPSISGMYQEPDEETILGDERDYRGFRQYIRNRDTADPDNSPKMDPTKQRRKYDFRKWLLDNGYNPYVANAHLEENYQEERGETSESPDTVEESNNETAEPLNNANESNRENVFSLWTWNVTII